MPEHNLPSPSTASPAETQTTALPPGAGSAACRPALLTWRALLLGHRHSGEAWPGKAAKAWPISRELAGYHRLFRVQNLGAPNHLCCSGLELYGLVRGAPPAPESSATPVVVTATPVGVAVGSGDAPPLFEMVEVLKRELGVGGRNMPEVVHAAAEALGLAAEVKGLALLDAAKKCWDVMGVPGPAA